jgi:hypothetical protein
MGSPWMQGTLAVSVAGVAMRKGVGAEADLVTVAAAEIAMPLL